MVTINLNGERLNYYLHQEGAQPPRAPIVLVHGAGGNGMHWPAALRRLPARTVYALDLPGHGKSGGAGCAEIGAYAEVVRGFAEALKLPAFFLAGHSMGGAIAIEFALRYPGRLAGLMLVSTGARLTVAPQILAGVQTDFTATTELLITWMHAETVEPNLRRLYLRRLREVAPAVLEGDFAACHTFDRRADVSRITHPTLILCGDVDRMTPLKYSQFLHGQIAGSQLVILPGAGHMAILEQPEAAAAALTAFLANHRTA